MICDIELYLKDETKPIALPVEVTCGTELANVAAREAKQLGAIHFNFGPHFSDEDHREIFDGKRGK
jgi:hypothetical protein